jgi:hypothetical protein
MCTCRLENEQHTAEYKETVREYIVTDMSDHRQGSEWTQFATTCGFTDLCSLQSVSCLHISSGNSFQRQMFPNCLHAVLDQLLDNYHLPENTHSRLNLSTPFKKEFS